MKAVIVYGEKGIPDMLTRLMNKKDDDERVIGFDADWFLGMPITAGGQRIRISHLIFSNGRTAFVFIVQDFYELPDTVISFLRNPEFTFVSMGVKETVAKLSQVYQVGCRNAVDLGRLAAKLTGNPRLESCVIDLLSESIGLSKTPRPSSVVFTFDGSNPDFDVFKHYELDEEKLSKAVANTRAYQRIDRKLLYDSV